MSSLDNPYDALTKKAQTANKDITREIVEDWVGDGGTVNKQIAFMLDTAIDTITKAMKNGDEVTLVGFGFFSVSKGKARTGRNPRKGQQ